jgi:hypothetical protein
MSSDICVEKVRVLARLKPALTAAERSLPSCVAWTDDSVTLTEPTQQVRGRGKTFFSFFNG